MDKLRKIIKYDKKMMLALSILVIVGIVTGSLFALILSTNDKEIVINGVQKFNENIIHGHYNYLDSFKNVFISNILITILIWILGLSIIGIVAVIFIVFFKSFTLGFTISSFILTFKFKGLILSFFYIFPSIIINILIFMYLSTYTIHLSLIMIKCIVGKKSLNFKSFMHNYSAVLVISLTGIIISGLYEVFINPFILKVIGNII